MVPINATQGLFVAVVVAAACTAAPRSARADCVSPAPALLWSYPSNGADDVPTNPVFWLVSSVWGARPLVTLNGKPLEISTPSIAFDAISIVPGELAPDSDFLLRVEFQATEGAIASATFQIPFHTANIRAQPPIKPSIARAAHIAAVSRESHACKDVISAQDCFDTGQDTLVEFELAPNDDAIAWLVQTEYPGASTLWPADCGKPALFGASPSSFGCVDIQALGRGGALSEKTRHCMSEPAASDPRPPAADGGSSVEKKPAANPSAARPTVACNLIAAGAAPHPSTHWLALSIPVLALRARRRLR